jgi:hypothetical protein
MCYFARPFKLGVIVPKKKIKRRRWTAADVRMFKKLARAKKSAPQLARTLKRTIGAIRVKASQLGISLDTRV